MTAIPTASPLTLDTPSDMKVDITTYIKRMRSLELQFDAVKELLKEKVNKYLEENGYEKDTVWRIGDDYNIMVFINP